MQSFFARDPSPGEETPERAVADREAAARESPYLGLQPYAERDAAFFFGRERERRVIAANLRAARVTLLYGASGVGKSSLLRAGVVPALRDRAAHAQTPKGKPQHVVVFL